MAATTASTRVRSWLHSRLRTTGLPVYPDAVREGVAGRAIVYRPVSGVDLINPRETIMVRSLFDVFVTDAASGSYAHDLQADADAAEAAILTGAMLSVGGRRVEAVRRVGEIDDVVDDDGVKWRRVGATYRIYSTTL